MYLGPCHIKTWRESGGSPCFFLICQGSNLQNGGKWDFWPHPPCSYESVWIPPSCPVYYQGEHILQLYGLYTHVHRDSSWFWDIIIFRKPKKRHFSHFSLSPGAWIIILQPPKTAFCEGGTMAQQNLKRKWGVTMLLSELPRLELAKQWKMGFFWPHPPLFIWKCMNPTLLPCILSGGTYSSTLWAVHPCTQGFELILGRHYLPQTQKTSFIPLFLVSWGMNNNFTTTQSSILWRWDHGTSKPEEKVGGHHASFWAAEARTCKTGWKWDFSAHPPPVHVMCFSIIFHPL